jgi:hypothetical protein
MAVLSLKYILPLLALALQLVATPVSAKYDRYFARYSCGGEDLLDWLRDRTPLTVLGYGCLPRGKKRVECVVAIVGVETIQLAFKCKGNKKKATWKKRSGPALPATPDRNRRSLRFLFEGDISALDDDLMDAVEDSVENQIQMAGGLAESDIHGVNIDPEAGHVDVLLDDAVDESKLQHTAVLVSAAGEARLSSEMVHLDN